jgi:hypothetical protein
VRSYDHMWKRPNRDIGKVNVNAAFKLENLSCATGAVACDG